MLLDKDLLRFHLHVCRGVTLELDILVHGGGPLDQVTDEQLVIVALK